MNTKRIFLAFVYAGMLVLSGCATFGFKSVPGPSISLEALTQQIPKKIAYDLFYAPIVRVYAQNDNSSGSGVYVTSEYGEFILTNHHIMEEGDTHMSVQFENDEFAEPARILGFDPHMDVVCLEVPKDIAKGIDPLPFVAPDDMRLLAQTYALGYPSGSRRITVGYINALKIPHIGQKHDYYISQTPIEPGSSGGGQLLIRDDGTIVFAGINTGIIAPTYRIYMFSVQSHSNVSYVINALSIHRILPRLITEGIVKHPWGGFNYIDSSDTVLHPHNYNDATEYTYPPDKKGVIIFQIFEDEDEGFGEPTADEPLQFGDYITAVYYKKNGEWHEIPFERTRQLRDFVYFELRVGDEVKMHLERRGEEVIHEFTLEEIS